MSEVHAQATPDDRQRWLEQAQAQLAEQRAAWAEVRSQQPAALDAGGQPNTALLLARIDGLMELGFQSYAKALEYAAMGNGPECRLRESMAQMFFDDAIKLERSLFEAMQAKGGAR